jgi:ADP-ribosyl-[dinitrogen reductase] hydrolase
VTWRRGDRELALAKAREHVALTHAGDSMGEAVALVADLLWQTLNGRPLGESILEAQRGQANRFARHPFAQWAELPDDRVIGPKLSPACYLDDSVPAVIFLALKYHDIPRQGLIANTMLGGDNVHRGIVLGALLGAENGTEAWPLAWRMGLKCPPVGFPGNDAKDSKRRRFPL